MAQDIKDMFKNETKHLQQKMPEQHEKRFLKKLNAALPEDKTKSKLSWYQIAASIVLMLGLGSVLYVFLNQKEHIETPQTTDISSSSLGEISPQLKKVEDYYLASINSELATLQYSPESKELFDGFVERLDELSNEYDVLAKELVSSGPNEDTVTALIDNLKLRLNLLYRLKEKLNELNSQTNFEEVQS